jgi:hypothetical protein
MAAWVKCTTTKGEMVFVNLDNALTMAQRGMRKETTLCFVGGSEALEVRETPEDLISSAAGGRSMRRTD